MDVDFLREVISFVTLDTVVQDKLGELDLDLETALECSNVLEKPRFPS